MMPRCPKCKSFEVVALHKDFFQQHFKCSFCGHKWWSMQQTGKTYDDNNIAEYYKD